MVEIAVARGRLQEGEHVVTDDEGRWHRKVAHLDHVHLPVRGCSLYRCPHPQSGDRQPPVVVGRDLVDGGRDDQPGAVEELRESWGFDRDT